MSWDRGAWERKTSGGEPYGGSTGSWNQYSSGYTKSSNTQKMNNIVELMRKGRSMQEACTMLNIEYDVAREWYNKGMFGEGNSRSYRDFYYSVSTIYNNRKLKPKKTTRTSYDNRNLKPKKTTTTTFNNRKLSQNNKRTVRNKTKYEQTSYISNHVKCPQCGKEYNKLVYPVCPHCIKSKSSNKVEFCPVCGGKILNGLSYCYMCGTSLKKGKIPSKEKTTTSTKPTKSNSSDWAICCAILGIILIIAFLQILF